MSGKAEAADLVDQFIGLQCDFILSPQKLQVDAIRQTITPLTYPVQAML